MLPAEATRPTAEFHYPILWPQTQIVEQLLGGLREMRVLNLQPPGGPCGLAKDITGCIAHAIDSKGTVIVFSAHSIIRSTALALLQVTFRVA